jgi:hypothetical protein
MSFHRQNFQYISFSSFSSQRSSCNYQCSGLYLSQEDPGRRLNASLKAEGPPWYVF